MDIMRALRQMVESSGLTHRQIARRMGRYDAYISQVLTRSDNPGIDTVESIARACGYRLVLMPTDGGDAITIGDESIGSDATEHSTTEELRGLLTRALRVLEESDLSGARLVASRDTPPV